MVLGGEESRGVVMGEGDATLTDFDPFGGSALADPYPQFAHFVEHQPVFWSAELGYWVVSRYADARRVLREHETFSAANALAPITPPCPAAARARSPTVASDRSRRSPTSTRRPTPAPAASPRWRSAPPRRRDGAVRARASCVASSTSTAATGTPRSWAR